MDINYQQSDTENGSITTSTAQEKFSFYFNLHSRPTSKLSLDGILRFDILENSFDPGSESTEIQPNTEIKLATSAVQLGFGYRRILRNENIVSGASTKTLTTDSSDAYADATLRAGKLPTIRVRYSLRDQKQEDGGAVTTDTGTQDLQAAINHRFGIIAVNADYRAQNSKDNMTGIITDQMQFAGQLSLAQRLGSKMDLGLRENYNYAKTVTDNVTTGRQSISTSEGRLVFNPFKGFNINTNYIYRLTDDMNASGTATERTWFTAANYVLPRFFRFYGSYQMLDSDNNGGSSQNKTGIVGVNFANTFGKFSVASRYEKRWDTHSFSSSGALTETETSRDNFDWIISARLATYLNIGLSESYVANTMDAGTSQDNRFRLKVDLGPLKNLMMAPYIDYDINNPAGGQEITTTQFVFPVNYRLSLHRRLELNLQDTYQWTNTESSAGSSSSQINNTTLRLALITPLPGTMLSGDATFTTNSSSTGESTSTSAYSVKGTWTKGPHAASANFRYQTGSNVADTTSLAFLYTLSLRMKNLLFSFQARYDYTIVFSTTESTAQTIYLMMSLRK